MKKAEKVTIALLAVVLACSLYLLFKPEPSTEPQLPTQTPVVENENPTAEPGADDAQ